MATFQFEGVDELISQYEKLADNSTEMIGKAIYNGAGTVMKAVTSSLDSIGVDNRFGTAENKTDGPSAIQKEGLRHSVGISKMRADGNFLNVKIGFSGYNRVKTKRWPNGQPNIMIAQAVESGTSWMNKQPFMRRAEMASKGPCEAVMGETIDKEIQKLMK